jgi:hypothetical protein
LRLSGIGTQRGLRPCKHILEFEAHRFLRLRR